MLCMRGGRKQATHISGRAMTLRITTEDSKGEKALLKEAEENDALLMYSSSPRPNSTNQYFNY